MRQLRAPRGLALACGPLSKTVLAILFLFGLSHVLPGVQAYAGWVEDPGKAPASVRAVATAPAPSGDGAQ
jgi:hypothetical protein